MLPARCADRHEPRSSVRLRQRCSSGAPPRRRHCTLSDRRAPPCGSIRCVVAHEPVLASTSSGTRGDAPHHAARAPCRALPAEQRTDGCDVTSCCARPRTS
jgi:hypothetical protein